MGFNLSANIENGWGGEEEQYIATPNASKVMQSIVDGYHSGIHSYTIIGSYGTGKSSFLLALESDLNPSNKLKRILQNPSVLDNYNNFEVINIVGDYADLSTLLSNKLNAEDCQGSVIDALRLKYEKCRANKKFLILVIDEFGKVLEHAADTNPEKELYFLQKLAEFVNVSTRKMLLLTTLHQNFRTYGKKLSEAQKNEWVKVKGRFQEIVFVEPTEQIMFLAAAQRSKTAEPSVCEESIIALQRLAQQSKFVSDSYTIDTAKSLSPLDPFSAYIITKAVQRYGQNERSLFSFIMAKGRNSLDDFPNKETYTYNLAEAYDYIERSFFSYLQDANSDSMSWSVMRNAIGRVEGCKWESEYEFSNAIQLIKAIGMLNLFGSPSFKMTSDYLAVYASKAMAMDYHKANALIKKLINFRIVRYAEYKSRLILFEGTDVDIEDELIKASLVVPRPENYIDDLRFFFARRVSLVKACYYHRGTPRYFKYIVLPEPEEITPRGDTDGYVELIFSPSGKQCLSEILELSSRCEKAIVFVLFKHTGSIINHIHNINKYNYLLEKVLIDKMDHVAINEVNNLKEHETELLNKSLFDGLYSYNGSVLWIYGGKEQSVLSHRDFNKLLSMVCDEIYHKTPIMNNELFNKHKLSSNISSAKVKYFDALVDNYNKEDLGFATDKFPPEKTIYYSLLKNTGLHKNGAFIDPPENDDLKSLWNVCEDFLAESVSKKRKISELQRILLEQPYKLKQGFLDFWIPTFLFIKRLDYSLYDCTSGSYIPNVNREFFDLLQKHPSDYAVKAFSVSGINIEFYNQYRKFINLGELSQITTDKFIETIKPFLAFYKRLNPYAKQTVKFNHETTLRFRDVLSQAKDPEKTFFEDLPIALGYDRESLKQEEFIMDYCSRIQIAVSELRLCFNQLIDRIEDRIVDELSLSSKQYSVYVLEIRDRLKSVKKYLLTDNQKEFFSHAMTEFESKTDWYKSICFTALGHSLETMRDEEEEKLQDNLIYLFRSCERYASISQMLSSYSQDEAFSFDLSDTTGNSIRTQTYRLSQKDKAESERLEKLLDEILPKNKDVAICTMLRIIKKQSIG